MKKTLLLSLICMLTFCGVALAQDIGGFWKTVDEKTGKAESIIALYQYQGKYFGRIIGSFDDNGNIKDSIYAPKGRATGVDGSPYYCGMDIIWNVQKRKSKYKGKIMDPRNGKVYNAGLWVRDGDLVVRGELLFFGRSVIWVPASESDFSAQFKKPDVTKFVPVIPNGD